MFDREPTRDEDLETALTGRARHLIALGTSFADAAADLRELAGTRADLLASAAGIHLGTYLGSPRTTDPHRLLAGALLAIAGADPDLIEDDIEAVRQWTRRPAPTSQDGAA
jgi:hypothetical protein